MADTMERHKSTSSHTEQTTISNSVELYKPTPYPLTAFRPSTSINTSLLTVRNLFDDVVTTREIIQLQACLSDIMSDIKIELRNAIFKDAETTSKRAVQGLYGLGNFLSHVIKEVKVTGLDGSGKLNERLKQLKDTMTAWTLFGRLKNREDIRKLSVAILGHKILQQSGSVAYAWDIKEFSDTECTRFNSLSTLLCLR
jgi:hypothetical protein